MTWNPTFYDQDNAWCKKIYNPVQKVLSCRVYHEEERKVFELEADCAPALEFLLHRYPAYVPVASLPLDSDEEKVIYCLIYDYMNLL